MGLVLVVLLALLALLFVIGTAIILYVVYTYVASSIYAFFGLALPETLGDAFTVLSLLQALILITLIATLKWRFSATLAYAFSLPIIMMKPRKEGASGPSTS